MELKPYQQVVIDDINRYMELVQLTKSPKKAFEEFWIQHNRYSLRLEINGAVEPYKEHILGVPNVCIKVPTAGGKTFIACNALKTIFDNFNPANAKAVVWLVPSVTILEQTIKNLRNTSHPYRQKINTHFSSRVEVYDKKMLLNGIGFNSTTIKEHLSIFVLSFDSLRARNKEDRKVHQENGQLLSFQSFVGEENEVSVSEVIRKLNPVVIVDESHNAETELSIEMLNGLNPSFVLDLTATPRKNSNILSFVDAVELKKENMVKLPVIVYNHYDKTSVINSALELQRSLETIAKREQASTGIYIRPIVLFQAEPKSKDDTITFKTLKEKLIEAGINREEIKIKTAQINEIENEDLMSPNCKVRYIITINALKEGWDCPFAYVLATIANKSSSVDVEQILGRILRQPYVKTYSEKMLNLSFVLTCSDKFQDTLSNIVKGLNRVGFSRNDFRQAEINQIPEIQHKTEELCYKEQLLNEEVDYFVDIDMTKILRSDGERTNHSSILPELVQYATELSAEYSESIPEFDIYSVPLELKAQMKNYKIKEYFKEIADSITLPQFVTKVPSNDIFSYDSLQLINRESLLEGFLLSRTDTIINFDEVDSEMYKLDIDPLVLNGAPSFMKVDFQVREKMLLYISDPSRESKKVENFTKLIVDQLGKLPPITESQIRNFVSNILENFDEERFRGFAKREFSYIEKIKSKINENSDIAAKKKFKDYLERDQILVDHRYKLPVEISPTNIHPVPISKSLYDNEIAMNDLEAKLVLELSGMDNIVFWTKNIEKRGFFINGPTLNHYPDFIALTKKGRILVIETKGDHLIATEKIELGNIWNKLSGVKYRYCLVYDQTNIEGSFTFERFINVVKDL